MPNPMLKIPFSQIDRAKSFDDICTVFTIFVTGDELAQTPFNLDLKDGTVKAQGEDTAIFFPGGKDQGKFEIWELADIVPSHIQQGGLLVVNPAYPQGVQERQYHKDENEQIKVRQNAANLSPQFLIYDNPDCVNGPPVITRSGVVLGGNSRTMSLALAYDDIEQKAKEYKDYLYQRAKSFGLLPGDIAMFKQPVLVRVINKDLSNADMAKMSRQYNTPLTQSMDANADGISRSKFITEECLAIFKTDIESNEDISTIRAYLDSPLSRRFVQKLVDDGALEAGKMSTYFEKKTQKLTQYGKLIIEAMLRGLIIDDYETLSATPKSVLQKIDKALSSLSALKLEEPKFNINEQLKHALELVVEYEKQKADGGYVDIKNFLTTNSGDLLAAMTGGEQAHDDKLERYKSDSLTCALFTMLVKCTQKQVTELLKNYLTNVKSNKKINSGMLGAGDIPDKVKKPKTYLRIAIEEALKPQPKNEKKDKKKKEKEKLVEKSLYESVMLLEQAKDKADIQTILQNCTSFPELVTVFMAIFGGIKESTKKLYQRLIDGEFYDQKPIAFLKILRDVYKEIQRDIEKIKSPTKIYIEKHVDWIM